MYVLVTMLTTGLKAKGSCCAPTVRLGCVQLTMTKKNTTHICSNNNNNNTFYLEVHFLKVTDTSQDETNAIKTTGKIYTVKNKKQN